MASSIRCPRCQATVSISDQPANEPLTCPHCATRIDNPEAIQAAPGAETRLTTYPPASEKPGPLEKPDYDFRKRNDSCSFIGLAIMGGIGVTAALAIALASLLFGRASDLFPEAFPLTITTILIIACSFGGVALAYRRKHHNGEEITLGRIIVITLALWGTLMAVASVLGFAIFVLLFAVCMSQIRRA